MPRIRMSPLALSAIALFASHQFAQAGPVAWSYQGEISSANGGPFVSFGVEEQPWFDPTTGEHGATPFHILGRVDNTFYGSATNSQTIHAHSLGIGSLEAHAIDDPWALNRPNTFQVQVTIIDQASGLSKTLEYEGIGHSNGFFLTGTGVVNLSLEDRMDDFVLGGNRYTVSARVRDSESAAHIELYVGVIHANPEPGTLALAGLGLGGLGVVRRLRRK